MLAASWAHWTTASTSLGRLCLRCSLPHSFSPPIVRFTVSRHCLPSKRRRHTLGLENHAVFSTGNDYYNTTIVPGDITNDGTSTAALAQLVKEKHYDAAAKVLAELLDMGVDVQPDSIYEEAIIDALRGSNSETKVSVLSNWLNLLPEAQHSNPGAFQEMIKSLFSSPQKKLDLAIQLGFAGARKGYMPLVEQEIIPRVARLANPSTLARFTGDVYVASRDYQKREKTASSAAVFEEMSEDYTTVLAEAAPVLPNTLELVENTLPPILPEYVAEDSAIFEDIDSDYVVYSSTLAHERTSSSDALAQLVANGKYEEAYRLLLECKELDVDISLSWIYEQAAISVLRHSTILQTEVSLQERMNQFSAWLSLIPLNLYKKPRTFSTIRHLVFNSPLTNVPLIAQFALILSSKGYASGISIHAIPVILRFFPQEVSHKFLKDFENANTAFWIQHRPESAPEMVRKTTANIRGIAVRVLSRSGRIDQALALLSDPNETGIWLTSYSYDALINAIRSSKDPLYMKHIPYIQSLKPSEPAKHEAAECVEMGNELADDADTPPNLTGHFSKPLPQTLRQLKNAVASTAAFPSPYDIADFFQAYLATGRTRGLIMLLDKALRSNFQSVSHLVFGEMLYYRGLKQHDLIIESYVDHFYVSGVPREEVLQRYQYIKEYRKFDRNVDAATSPTRFWQLSERSAFPRGKSWPQKIHNDLVWDALVALAPDVNAVDRLYKKLLQFARKGDVDPEHPPLNEISQLLPPPSFKIDSVAFTPFMRRLMIGFGAYRGTQILRDMLEIGIEPTAYHYTELAGFYARVGDTQRAKMILQRLEESWKKSTETCDGGHASTQASFPMPDTAMYNSIMQGFLIARNLEGAEEVEQRSQIIHKYIAGEDQSSDVVREGIRKLRFELGSQVPPVK